MSDLNPRAAVELISAIKDLVQNYEPPGEKPDVAPVARNPMIDQVALSFTDEHHAPWVGLSEKGKQTNLDPSAELHSKMLWLAKTMPGGISLRQLVLDATEKHVNELIAQHYKP